MGGVGVSVALLLVGCVMAVGGVFMAAGPWWALAVAGLLVAVYAAFLRDVGAPAEVVERPVRSVR